jgi:hypothetical protein
MAWFFGLDFLGIPWILSSESRLFSGLAGISRLEYFHCGCWFITDLLRLFPRAVGMGLREPQASRRLTRVRTAGKPKKRGWSGMFHIEDNHSADSDFPQVFLSTVARAGRDS